jgi:hypothetical protein
MNTLSRNVSHRIVRHAGGSPGWVVQFHDTDSTYWVSYWDGGRWTKVARQRQDGTIVDEIVLTGAGDDAAVQEALDQFEHRKDEPVDPEPHNTNIVVGVIVVAVMAVVVALVGLLAFL